MGATALLMLQPVVAATLDIYDIDTEGGAAILFVTPDRQSVLIDTGNSGVRDASRIATTIKSAELSQIDYLVITHYHADHVGGFPELAKLVPIRHYVDHGPNVEQGGESESKQAYDAAAAESSGHLIVKPGDRLPVAGIDWRIVSSAGRTLSSNLTGPNAGKANPWCAAFKEKQLEAGSENAQSVGSVVTYGRFRAIELGDLLWNLEAQLACPVNRIGEVQVLLTTHHGLDSSGVPALVNALQPVVTVMNNGAQKGAAVETFRALEAVSSQHDLWQLHWSYNGGLEYNAPGRFIANVEDPASVAAYLIAPSPKDYAVGVRPRGDPDHAIVYSIRISAQKDGSFSVTNSRNGFTKRYAAPR